MIYGEMYKGYFCYNRLKRYFTIVEVSVAMLVLAVLLTIVMQFFESVQKGWSISSEKTTIYENARIALGLINRQIQGIYYENNVVPFYHKGTTDTINEYANDLISFVSYLDEPPNEKCTSTACEIQYQLYYNSSDVIEDTAGWLLISVTGNKNDDGSANDKWNFYNYNINGLDVFTEADDNSVITSVFSADDDSRNSYMKLIPYVTDLQFTCYKQSGGVETDSQALPYSIEVKLSLMGKDAWNKWLSLFPAGDFPERPPTEAVEFKNKYEQLFIRTVYIGTREQ